MSPPNADAWRCIDCRRTVAEGAKIHPCGSGQPRKRCRACGDKAQRQKAKAPPSSGAVVVLTDIHIPEHDRPFWRAALQILRDVRPAEVVLSGDFGEYGSVSMHGGSVEARLTDDFADVKRALNEVREAAGPDCRITYLEGNHETRLTRTIAEKWAPLAGSITIPVGLDLAERGIAWVEERHQPIRRGKLRILHGHQFGGRFGSKHHAMKAAEIYAPEPGTVIVYGHTHRPQTFTRPVVGGVVTAIGLGCGRAIAPDEVRWLQGREAGWAHELAVCYVDEATGEAQVYPVRICGGVGTWAGKRYDGRASDAA